MSLSVQTNIEAFDAHRNLVNTSNQLSNSMQKLSSGYRINKAADDAAGLAISEKLSAQVSGLTQAQQNAQDAVNLVQTADGAMGEVQSILARVRDLAVEFNNGTLSTSDQAAITAEVAQLCAEISSIGTETPVQRHRPADRQRHHHLPGGRQRRRDDRHLCGQAVRLGLGLRRRLRPLQLHRRDDHAVGDRHRHRERLERPGDLRRRPEPARSTR